MPRPPKKKIEKLDKKTNKSLIKPIDALGDIDLANLSRADKVQLFELLNAYDDRLRYNKLHQWFPESGPFRRDLYWKSLQFFLAGPKYKTRVIFGGNQSGKSTTVHWEAALHATGLYPEWWDGIRFEDPIEIWICGDTHADVRDIGQTQLCGNISDIGSGMIPKECLVDYKSKQSVPNGIDHILVRHVNGGIVKVCFKSYVQGRKEFQGRPVDFIVLDEEPPSDVYDECLARTITRKGKIVFSFTSLQGLTPLVLNFLPQGKFPENNIVPGQSAFVTNITWDDIPHLSEDEKQLLIANWPAHMIEARTKGIPMVGAGRVFTVPEADFVVQPFDIPADWPRFYALDIPMFSGRTACVWFAWDKRDDILYLYAEYKCSQEQIPVPVSAILAKGNWIRGVIDPSAKRKASDGDQYMYKYASLGLDLRLADNSVGPGVLAMQVRLQYGKMKVFNCCTGWLQEYRIYRYDKNGDIAKNQEDDYMDATRYGVMSGLSVAQTRPDHDRDDEYRMRREWKRQSRDTITGY